MPQPTDDGKRKPVKPRVMIRPTLHSVAEAYAAAHDKEVAQVVNDALRSYLEREGVWPPKAPAPQPEGQ